MRAKVWGAAVALAALLVGGAAHAEWLRAESAHFVVYGRSERGVRLYATQLEDFDGLLRRRHGRPKDEATPRKLPVYLVSSLSELQRIQPRLERAAGVYFPSPGETFVVAVRDGVTGDNDENKGDDAVLHEYVHHFMLRYYPSAYPAWLVEGYAEYYMTADLGAKQLVFGGVNRGRARTLTQPGSWIPIEDVLTKRPGALRRDEGAAYYAQAWLLTHYVISNPERYKRLKAYLDDARDSRDAIGAWKRVYGDDPKALRLKLQDYMSKPIPGGALLRTESGEPAMTITRLPASADGLLLESQRMKIGVADADQPAFLAAVRKAAAKAGDDRFAKVVLARAETRYGDRALGEGMLNALLAADPQDLEALIALGESRLAAGAADAAVRPTAFAEAAKLFARAFKLDPDNPVVLRGYANSKALEPLTSRLVDIRLKAVEMGPEVGLYRLEAARALIATKEPVIAKAVLMPLARSPHGGEAVDAAQAMVKAIDEAAAGAPVRSSQGAAPDTAGPSS